jgi:hypothetical protein
VARYVTITLTFEQAEAAASATATMADNYRLDRTLSRRAALYSRTSDAIAAVLNANDERARQSRRERGAEPECKCSRAGSSPGRHDKSCTVYLNYFDPDTEASRERGEE